MPTTLYADPTGNGTNTFGYGSYTNVDDGIRQPTAPTDAPATTERVYADAGGSLVCELTFSFPAVANARITSVTAWMYKAVNGSVNTSVNYNLSGTNLGSGTVESSPATGWQRITWGGLAIDLSSGLTPAITLTGPSTLDPKSDTEDEYSGIYFEYTYEDVSAEDVTYTKSNHSVETDSGGITLNGGSTANLDEDNEYVAFQFDELDLDQGEVVTKAVLQFQSGSDCKGNVIIKGELSTSPADLTTTAFDVSNRSVTTESVSLGPASEGEMLGVDVTAILQEIVDQGGWTTLETIVFLIEGVSPESGDFRIAVATPAKLSVDHANAGAGGGGGAVTKSRTRLGTLNLKLT